MKKFTKIVLAVLMTCTLTACSSWQESAAKNAVNSYYVALEEGDLDKAYDYVNADTNTDFTTLKNSEDSLNTALDQYNISDDTKALFKQAYATIIKYCVRSHSIKSTERVSDTEYKVTVDASILSSEDITNAVSTVDTSTYLNSIADQVTEKYQSEGEQAAAEFMMSSLAPWIQETYTTALKDLTPTTQTVIITVDQSNSKWQITNMENQ